MSEKKYESKQFIINMPKVELHAHINGSISEETILKLVTMKREREPNWGQDGNWEVNMAKGTCRTMQEGFEMFALIHQLSDTDEAAYMITKDVIEEFAAENVKYLELRTTPRAVKETGMSKKSYITSVLKAVKELSNRPDLDIIVKLLLAIDRRTNLDDAIDTVMLATELRNSSDGKDVLVGIDLSGDPNKGDARLFLPVLKDAKEKDLKLALHLSEVQGQNEESAALLTLPPDRIGHGTFLHPEVGGSDELVDVVLKHQIPLELCLTSNLKTATVSSPDKHQFAYWYEKEHLCCICTDDKGVFCTSLSEEYMLAAKAFNLTKNQLWDLTYSSIDFIFADEKSKKVLREKWDSCKERLFN